MHTRRNTRARAGLDKYRARLERMTTDEIFRELQIAQDITADAAHKAGYNHRHNLAALAASQARAAVRRSRLVRIAQGVLTLKETEEHERRQEDAGQWDHWGPLFG
jgi:hypothetical protein